MMQVTQMFLPGTFVVLQGMPGDGLSNTMDSLPDLDLVQQLNQHELDADEWVPNNVDEEEQRNNNNIDINDSYHHVPMAMERSRTTLTVSNAPTTVITDTTVTTDTDMNTNTNTDMNTDMNTNDTSQSHVVSPHLAGILASNVVSMTANMSTGTAPPHMSLSPLVSRVQAASLYGHTTDADDYTNVDVDVDVDVDSTNSTDDEEDVEDVEEDIDVQDVEDVDSPNSNNNNNNLLSQDHACGGSVEDLHSFVVVTDDIDSSQSHHIPNVVAQQVVAETKVASRKTPRRNQEQASPQQQQQQLHPLHPDTTDTDTDTRKSVRNLRSGEMHALDKWSADCREREIMHQAEWRECAMSTNNLNTNHTYSYHSTQTTTARLTNSSPSGQATPSNKTAQTWWLSAHEGQRLAVFESLPRQIVGTLFFPQAIGTLHPGTTVIGTECITLDSRTFARIDTTTMSRPSATGSATNFMSRAGQQQQQQQQQQENLTIVPRGRDGWIQLLKVESPVSGYLVLSLNGYPFMAPGLPSTYLDPAIWMWRVTCPVGAFVRAGLDLSTSHIDTIPYGSFVHVKRKTVNVMGLSRLQIQAVVDQPDGSRGIVDGWCSEFLNPLSGQRGSIVQPVPFSVPALYRVALPEGAVIRSDVELSSPQIGHAPVNAVLVVTGRAFSEHPMDKCIERLRLAGNGGWVSVRLNKTPPADRLVVEFEGTDGSFEPNYPGIFHLDALLRVRQEQDQAEGGGSTSGRCVSTTDLSSIDDDEDRSSPVSSSTLSTSQELGAVGSINPKPSCTYSAQAKNYNNSSRSAARGNNSNSSDELCLICRSEERNATIVHGETGHVACCLTCARMLKARGDCCLVCRLPIDSVIQHFWA